jgi:hypothetical protein
MLPSATFRNAVAASPLQRSAILALALASLVSACGSSPSANNTSALITGGVAMGETQVLPNFDAAGVSSWVSTMLAVPMGVTTALP